ncbi:hypothetical protein BDZ45DRAFT_693137 [Acephala macrosclerotiorum]|nr:hypothetical protein BDZ45DRAFT_693137 [Acephala macrosclerotiorum]
MGTGVGKTLLFQLLAKSMNSGTTIVISPLVSLQEHMVERCQQAGISCVKWDFRHCHSPSQIVIVTLESAVSKTFETFLDRLQGLHQLDRFVFDECYTVLDSTAEFRPIQAEKTNLESNQINSNNNFKYKVQSMDLERVK